MENPLSVWEYPSYIMEKYAAVLFWSLGKARKKPLKKSDFIQVRFDLPALPLAEEIVGLLHENGMVPLPVAEPTAKMQHDRLEYANNKRLTIEIPGKRELYGSLAGTHPPHRAPSPLTHLMDVDPEAERHFPPGSPTPGEHPAPPRTAREEYGWTVGVYPSPDGCGRLGTIPGRLRPADQTRLHARTGAIRSWTGSSPSASSRPSPTPSTPCL